jgi:hypothetical protein
MAHTNWTTSARISCRRKKLSKLVIVGEKSLIGVAASGRLRARLRTEHEEGRPSTPRATLLAMEASTSHFLPLTMTDPTLQRPTIMTNLQSSIPRSGTPRSSTLDPWVHTLETLLSRPHPHPRCWLAFHVPRRATGAASAKLKTERIRSRICDAILCRHIFYGKR